MFHYVEPNEENVQKKRVVEKLIKANIHDRGLGLTKPEAESVESLLRACEDIETQGEIVLKSLSQSLLRNSHVAQEGIHRFYTVIRKGIFTLARATFKQTPKTDIKNLIDYRDNINKLMIALNETFNLLNEELYGNAPLKGRTLEQYQAEEQKPYRHPVKTEALKKSLETKTKKQIETLQQKLASAEQEYLQLQSIIEQQLTIKQSLEQRHDFNVQNLQVLQQQYATASPAERRQLQPRIDGLERSIDTLTRKNDETDAHIFELEQRQQNYPEYVQNIERQINDLKLPFTALLEEHKGFEKEAEVVNKDFSLVMKDLNIFVNSLTDGLIRYTSSTSSQLQKTQITTYRTPTEQAEDKLGLGRFKGHHGYDHKRFL
jgi:chromosome segregation ATPase